MLHCKIIRCQNVDRWELCVLIKIPRMTIRISCLSLNVYNVYSSDDCYLIAFRNSLGSCAVYDIVFEFDVYFKTRIFSSHSNVNSRRSLCPYILQNRYAKQIQYDNVRCEPIIMMISSPLSHTRYIKLFSSQSSV